MQRVRRHGRFLAFSVPKGRLVAQRRLLRIWIPLLVSSSSATVRRRVEFCALRRNSSCAPLTHMCAVCVFVSGSWVHARRDWRRRMHGSRVGGGGVLRILIASYRRRGRTTSIDRRHTPYFGCAHSRGTGEVTARDGRMTPTPHARAFGCGTAALRACSRMHGALSLKGSISTTGVLDSIYQFPSSRLDTDEWRLLPYLPRI